MYMYSFVTSMGLCPVFGVVPVQVPLVKFLPAARRQRTIWFRFLLCVMSGHVGGIFLGQDAPYMIYVVGQVTAR